MTREWIRENQVLLVLLLNILVFIKKIKIYHQMYNRNNGIIKELRKKVIKKLPFLGR